MTGCNSCTSGAFAVVEAKLDDEVRHNRLKAKTAHTQSVLRVQAEALEPMVPDVGHLLNIQA